MVKGESVKNEITLERDPTERTQLRALSIGQLYEEVLNTIQDSIPPHVHKIFRELFPDYRTNVERLSAILGTLLDVEEEGTSPEDVEGIGLAIQRGPAEVEQLPTFLEFLSGVKRKIEFLQEKGYNGDAFADRFMRAWIEVEISSGNITREEVQNIYDEYNRQKMLALWAELTQEERDSLMVLPDAYLDVVIEYLKEGKSIPTIQRILGLKSRWTIEGLLKRNGHDSRSIRRMNPMNRYREDVFPKDQYPRILTGEITQVEAAREISSILSKEEGRETEVSASSIYNWCKKLGRET